VINNKSKKHISSKYLKRIVNFDQLSKISQLELLKCIFERSASVRMSVYGISMAPFIRSGDVITLSPLDGQPPQIGDIVAFEQAETKKLIIHRIIRKNQNWCEMKGDNCSQSDRIISIKSLLGTVTNIEHKSRHANFGISKAKRWIASLSRRNILQRLQKIIRLPITLSKSLLGKLQLLTYFQKKIEKTDRLNDKEN
jgi:signal peptidase I